MAYLFEIQDRIVYPNAETLLVEPFKSIWDRDKSPNKEIALKELAYIEFVSSVKKSNPYKGYEEAARIKKVKEDIIKDEDWVADDLIYKGLKRIKEFQTEGSLTYQYYMANKKAAENMIDFFNNVDINERNDKGYPVWKPADLTRAIKDASSTLSTLKDLEQKVEEELFEEVKNRSDKKISPLADPSSI